MSSIEFNKDGYLLFSGDCRNVLKTLDENSVDCCITSPPYFNLRDYGESNQIGIEDTPEQYISSLVDVFREVRRVLKDDGTLWVNIGDSYCNSNGYKRCDKKWEREGRNNAKANDRDVSLLTQSGLKVKDKIGIPWMLAFALRQDGWYLRQDIIWCLSGGTYLYVKSQKGIQPMAIKEMIRLNPKTVQLWNGEKWVNVIGYGKSNNFSNKLEIVLRSGERIQCTDGHKWVLEDGTEKVASELSIGDVLKSCHFEDANGHQPTILTKDVLWLMGLYIAEGSRSDDCIQLSLNVEEIKWIERIKSVITDFGGTITYTINGNSLSIRIYSQVFNAVLHQYIGGNSAKNKHLNNICWSMSNDNLKELITGYFDGDGHYDIENNRIRLNFTRNYNWERDLRLLANRLNASLTLKLSTAKIGDKRFPSFRGEWRWEISEHRNNKSRNEIVEIKKGKGRNYYDISVDCDNHLFSLASGVLTHNCKPNPMPESVKDRCTSSHEYIFLLSKSSSYYFDYEAIQEIANYDGRKDTMMHGGSKYAQESIYPDDKKNNTMASKGHQRWKFKQLDGVPRTKNCQYDGQVPNSIHLNRENGGHDEVYAVRNKRDVWTVPTKGYEGAHFATYPKQLIEPCVLAGSRKDGIVLDPFSGAGTTGIVAIKNGRKYIGIELNKEYIEITENRFKTDNDFTQKLLF